MTKQLSIDCLLFSLYNMNLTTRGPHIIWLASIVLDLHPLPTSSVSMPVSVSTRSFGNTQSMFKIYICQGFTVDNLVWHVDDDIVTTLKSTSSHTFAKLHLDCYLVTLRIWQYQVVLEKRYIDWPVLTMWILEDGLYHCALNVHVKQAYRCIQ
jgi:hypothetical protein